MIKVFNNTQEYNTYTQGGLVAGDLYYVLENGSVHFRTNNIDGEDKVYDKTDEGSSEPEYVEITSDAEGQFFIPCKKGDIILFVPNSNYTYGPLATFDSNKEYISDSPQRKNINIENGDVVYINDTNTAFLLIMAAGYPFVTGSYRILN